MGYFQVLPQNKGAKRKSNAGRVCVPFMGKEVWKGTSPTMVTRSRRGAGCAPGTTSPPGRPAAILAFLREASRIPKPPGCDKKPAKIFHFLPKVCRLTGSVTSLESHTRHRADRQVYKAPISSAKCTHTACDLSFYEVENL